MADDSTDASNIEQLKFAYVRWTGRLSVREEYIGLMPVAQTNADTIVFASKMCWCV